MSLQVRVSFTPSGLLRDSEKKKKLNIKTEEASVDYMHSSCIVVRLDWAAGLPAWLIRSFGS